MRYSDKAFFSANQTMDLTPFLKREVILSKSNIVQIVVLVLKCLFTPNFPYFFIRKIVSNMVSE